MKKKKKPVLRLKPIICKMCGEKYKRDHLLPEADHTQTTDCAAGIYLEKSTGKRWLWCYYGSDFDSNLYLVLGPYMPMEPVCDNCVRRMKDAGELKLVNEDLALMPAFLKDNEP